MYLVLFICLLTLTEIKCSEIVDDEFANKMVDVFYSLGDLVNSVKSIQIENIKNTNGETGRGTKGLMRVAVPLIVGFKFASFIVASIISLKLLLLKSLGFSAMAMMFSMVVGFKYFYDKMQSPLLQETPYNANYGQMHVISGDYGWNGVGDQSLQGYDFKASSSDFTSSTNDLGQFPGHILTNSSRRYSQLVPQIVPYKTVLYKTITKRRDV